MIKSLINIIKQKTKPQKLFGFVMFINYMAYFFIFDYHSNYENTSLILRGFACLLCLSLIFINYEEDNLYKKLYWYITLTYCLPFFFTFMSLVNNLSTIWMMNSISATFFMIILLRLRLFFILFFIGVIYGIILYKYILTHEILIIPNQVTIYDILATYVAVVVIGSLFAFNRDEIEKEREKNSNKIIILNQSLEQKVLNRTSELKKALDTKTEFLNNMSHEIRTPIHGFTTISKGLVDNWSNLNDTKKYNYVEMIATSAKKLEKLLLNLLSLSIFTTKEMSINLSKINLSKLIDLISSEYNATTENRIH